jgi:dTDP-glucose 4,6-dehydratase
MRDVKSILVTGGAGFIGSNFIHYLFEKIKFRGKLINLDNLTYAGNLDNLAGVEKKFGNKNYFFIKGDICNFDLVENLLKVYNVDTVVNFAAESHVDRSIFGPKDFINTNINGTFSMLEVARKLWADTNDLLFHHISTDEVYGSLGETGQFYETSPYSPNSPYSASKAASDHIVKAYYHTYKLPITISNCSNNYGPYQYPEKFIPLLITNMIEEKELPVYGDGRNIRDWLFVLDHCDAIWQIIINGRTGQTYNIGGDNEKQNIEVLDMLCDKIAQKLNKDPGHYKKFIKFVKDRPGHDRRYAINCDKIKKELNWKQSVDFDKGLDITIEWYLNNNKWCSKVMEKQEFKTWIKRNY